MLLVKQTAWFLSIFFTFTVSLGLIYMYHNADSNHVEEKKMPAKENSSTKPKPNSKGKPTEQTTSITLGAVGDILIHDTVYNKALQSGQYNFNPNFALVQTYLKAPDVTIANQETMIGGTGLGLSSYPAFNSPQEVGDALKENGVDVVTLANNHTLDRGENAIINAINYWNEIELIYTGAYLSVQDQQIIRILTRNGITLSFLSYTYGTNGIPIPAGKDHLVNLIEEERIKMDIDRAKKISDVVVVSLHFGNEYERLPNAFQEELAQLVAEAGGDIIIGHHPHVLQPFQWITASDGSKTFIAYSLGNFLSGQRREYKDIGGILQLTITKTVRLGEKSIDLVDPTFLPTYVDREFIIHPLKDLPDMERTYNEIKRHMNKWVPELKFFEDL
jgi:poly-gamma-glutamate capsule biosynthesis protein CapA/YwtB (metallophosphatase superfamily)